MKVKKVSPVLNRTNKKRSSADQLERFLSMALNGLLEIMGMDTGWLHLLVPGRNKLLASACQGCTAEMENEADSLALKEAGRPAAAADAIIVPDLSRAADPALAAFLRAGFASLIVVPLRTNLFQGSLGAVSREPAAFDGESSEILKLKAGLIGAVLEKEALSRGLAELLAEQAQPARRGKDFKRITAIAGNQYRKVRQAMEKADKKFTQATINLLKQPGWEGLIEEYDGGQPAPAIKTAGPEAGTAPENPAPSEAAATAPADKPSEPPAGLEAESKDTFKAHSGRIKAFRRSHADLR